MSTFRRYTFSTGAFFACVGLAITLFGYVRSAHDFVRIRGVITESTAMSGAKAANWRLINYAYDFDGKRYNGITSVRHSLGHEDGYSVGHALPVYVVQTNPETSYGFEPPHKWPSILIGVAIAALGAGIIFFGWLK